MKLLDKLNLTKEQEDLILNSFENYKRHARIFFDIIKYEEKKNAVTVKVWQEANVANKYLSQKELREKAKEVFSHIDVTVYAHATEYIAAGLHEFTIEDVKRLQEKHKLTQKDLCEMTDIDKSSMSLILSGDTGLSKTSRAMFFYLFKYLEK